MKTNKILKMLTALTGILIILSMTPAVFAQADNSAAGKGTAETQTNTDGSDAKTPQKPSRKSGQPDFSKLPENLTEEDLEEFFEKYFSEKGPRPEDGKKSDGKYKKGQTTENIEMPGEQNMPAEPQVKNRDFPRDPHSKDSRPFPPKCDNDRDDDDDDDDDDEAEDLHEHKGFRKHGIDFSELPDNPTDEEILDFFKKNFPGKNKPEGTETAPITKPTPQTPEKEPSEEPTPETL